MVTEGLRELTDGPAHTAHSLNDQDILDNPHSTALEVEEAELRRSEALAEQERVDDAYLELVGLTLEAGEDPQRVTIRRIGCWCILIDGEIAWEL